MPEKEPLITAHQIRNRLEHLNLVTDEKTIARILARIPKDILEKVRQAKRDQWLPVKINVDITECMAAEIGDEGVYNLSLKTFNHVIDSSIVSPFFRAALSIAKIQPGTVLKLVPIFWRSIYRNCGEMSIVENSKTRVQIILRNLPTVVSGSRNYLMAIAGGIHAVYTFGGINGLIILEKFSSEDRQATFIASWTSNLMRDKKPLQKP